MKEYDSCTAYIEGEAPAFLRELSALTEKYKLALIGPLAIGLDESPIGAYVLTGGANGVVEWDDYAISLTREYDDEDE